MEQTSIPSEGCLQREDIQSSSGQDKDASTVQSSRGSTHKSVTRTWSLAGPRKGNLLSHAVLERNQSYLLACCHSCRSSDGSHEQRVLASMRDSLPGSSESLEDVSDLVDTEPSVIPAHESQLYEQGEQELQNCSICFSDTPLVRPCCEMPACDICVMRYIREKVSVRVINISCPNPFCNDSIPREEIILNLSSPLHNRFLRYLIDENREPNQKTCPDCNLVANFEDDVIVTKRVLGPDKYLVSCPCGLLWCFHCHAPWHKNVSCKQYQRGDRLLRKWAEEHQRGQLNACKCPKCKVLIQRIDGCNYMACNQCRTNFCYDCGKRMRITFFGDHNSRYSVFGCKKSLMPDNVVIRKAIRGTVFGCEVTAAGFGIILAVGVGILAVGVIGVVAIGLAPVYVPYIIRRENNHRQSRRRRFGQPQVEEEGLP